MEGRPKPSVIAGLWPPKKSGRQIGLPAGSMGFFDAVCRDAPLRCYSGASTRIFTCDFSATSASKPSATMSSSAMRLVTSFSALK